MEYQMKNRESPVIGTNYFSRTMFSTTRSSSRLLQRWRARIWTDEQARSFGGMRFAHLRAHLGTHLCVAAMVIADLPGFLLEMLTCRSRSAVILARSCATRFPRALAENRRFPVEEGELRIFRLEMSKRTAFTTPRRLQCKPPHK